MAKPLRLSFPVKSATTLASQLGVSKARMKRISAIVERNGKRRAGMGARTGKAGNPNAS